MHTNLSPPPGGTPSRHPLASVQPPAGALPPGTSVECAVAHELKELGAHALVCTVSYGVEVPAEEAGDGGPDGAETRVVTRSFRKVRRVLFALPLPLSPLSRTLTPRPDPTRSTNSKS